MDGARIFGLFEDDLPAEQVDAEFVLEKLLHLRAVEAPLNLKEKVLARIGFAGEELQLDNLPPTSRHSNYLSWLKAMEPLLPNEPVESMFLKEIRRDERYVQSLVVTKVNVPEEVHESYAESFFILEGRCACTIDGQVFEIAAGDYLPIPLHVPHDVRLLTPQVTAILQYELC
ncbi:cupin domain-containing protein [Mucilaginibacter psychrotolerans]|uniref:Cupin domain-containing protein n=1 Tax=Mucilaginibacter psychrotolerans TaxID=1524096 RepID=A0A4Y8SIR3_9SPHI|nr:cupin domain-containing protein [Mucilaginibacter psychrotolerans]TFF38540.1 cupin domain-containing protein [Mucilaginibacter psychrotolerans]